MRHHAATGSDDRIAADECVGIDPGSGFYQRAGFRVSATRRTLVARSYRRDVSVDWLRANWYMTLGDTDLV